MTSFIKKVTFDECINIRHYEYDRDEDYKEKRGDDWQRTTDLTCREFKLPLEKGGCGGNWHILQSKLDELKDPYWCLVGQLWQRLFPCIKRIEESSSDDEDEFEEINQEFEDEYNEKI